jgi:nitrogen fixation NifU-like protein
MSELRELYQQVILDHNKKPRNFRRLAHPTGSAEGFNPLCGDRVAVELDVGDDGVIRDVGFQGTGCAISRAAASIMTSEVRGKTTAEALRSFERFRAMVTGDAGRDADEAALDDRLAVFAGVREFPARVKCATLAWHTLSAALSGAAERVTTE